MICFLYVSPCFVILLIFNYLFRFLTFPSFFTATPLLLLLLSRFHVEGEPRRASVYYRVGQPAPGGSSSTERQPQVSHYRGRSMANPMALDLRSDTTVRLLQIIFTIKQLCCLWHVYLYRAFAVFVAIFQALILKRNMVDFQK